MLTQENKVPGHFDGRVRQNPDMVFKGVSVIIGLFGSVRLISASL